MSNALLTSEYYVTAKELLSFLLLLWKFSYNSYNMRGKLKYPFSFWVKAVFGDVCCDGFYGGGIKIHVIFPS